jgi:putative PIN family toxin of toxin-antitoxin system
LKAVFDTNIFVSALAIPGGQAERAVDLIIDGRVNLCISKEIIHEVLDVLAHKFSRGSEELARTAVFLSDLAELVAPRHRLAVLDDEPDNRILECAVAGQADVIVTRDPAMLKLETYQEIRILSLRHFLDEIADRSLVNWHEPHAPLITFQRGLF